MALGAGSVTPMQMAVGYSVFANGGYRVNPYLVTKITDQQGQGAGGQATHPAQRGHARAIPRATPSSWTRCCRWSRAGTAAKAQATLKRPDLYGKTGTTNDSLDTWFVGFQPTLTAIGGSATTRRATSATAKPAAA
jgi:penicillin-binding protein 1A